MEQYTNTETADKSTAASPKTANTANTAPAAPQPPQRVRRVGTVAFGLTMIAAGALLLLRIFIPTFNFAGILKFSPILLIVLGIEVLVYAVRPNVKLKYDFASMFLCFILVCGIGCASVAGELLVYYGPAKTAERDARKHSLTTAASETIAAMPDMRTAVRDMTVYLDYEYESITSTGGEGHAQLYVTMQRGIYTDAASYAKACRAIMDACMAKGLALDGYTFDTWYGENESLEKEGLYETYALDATSPWLLACDAAALTDRVRTEYWYNSESYGTAADRDEAIREYAAEGNADEQAFEEAEEAPAATAENALAA